MTYDKGLGRFGVFVDGEKAVGLALHWELVPLHLVGLLEWQVLVTVLQKLFALNECR